MALIPRLTIDAFATAAETKSALETAAADRRFAKSRLSVHDGGLAAAAAFFAENPTPHVIMIEVDDDTQLADGLQALAETVEPGVRVIMLGQRNDIELYRSLIGQGVSEYLVAPPRPEQVVDTVLALFKDPATAPRGRTIAFFGARGGVGSSILAQNVAWSLAERINEPVILIDFDLSFGTADLDFNVEVKYSLADLLRQWQSVESGLFDRYLVAHGPNLRILAGSGNLPLAAPPPVEALEKVLELASQVAFVVLDVPHEWAEWTQSLLEGADDLVIVARPDLPNLRDCKNLFAAVAAKRQLSPTRLVLNMMDAAKKTQLTVKDFQDTLSVSPAATIAFDPALFGEAANSGRMIGEAAKSHRVTLAIGELAWRLSGREVAAGKKKKKGGAGVFGWLRQAKAPPAAKRSTA